MSDTTRRLLEHALTLPTTERVALVEELLSSLDRPDAGIDELWAREAEDRRSAYDEGRIKAIPAEDVFRELGHS